MSIAKAWKRWLVRGIDFDLRRPPAIDFHMHSLWTDGLSTNAENIEAAREQGLAAIAVTEHVNAQSSWYPRFAEELRELRQNEDRLEVYCGMEVAATDYQGRLKADQALLEKAELVVGVVHSYPKEQGGFWRFEELSPADAFQREIAALEGLVTNPAVEILGHPGGTCFRHYGPFPIDALEPIFVVAERNGTVIEVNIKYCWDLEGLLRLLARTNPWVSIGSDAHRAVEVGLCRRRLKELSPPLQEPLREDVR